MSDVDTIRDAVGDALSDALAGESEMVTRWVVLVEVMDKHGNRAAYVMAPDGAKAWDTLGLLTFAVQWEQAHVVINDMDDGDYDA